MSLEAILGLLGGGVGVFLLKFYADWSKNKRGDTKDVVGAWQQIADRESARIKNCNSHVEQLDKLMLEKDFYISQLENMIIGAGLSLPVKPPTAAVDTGTQAQ